MTLSQQHSTLLSAANKAARQHRPSREVWRKVHRLTARLLMRDNQRRGYHYSRKQMEMFR